MTQQFIGSVTKSKTIDSDEDEFIDALLQHNKSNKTRSRAKLLGGKDHARIKSLYGNESTDQLDKNNIFRVMKRHLKSTKVTSSCHDVFFEICLLRLDQEMADYNLVK